MRCEKLRDMRKRDLASEIVTSSKISKVRRHCTENAQTNVEEHGTREQKVART